MCNWYSQTYLMRIKFSKYLLNLQGYNMVNLGLSTNWAVEEVLYTLIASPVVARYQKKGDQEGAWDFSCDSDQIILDRTFKLSDFNCYDLGDAKNCKCLLHKCLIKHKIPALPQILAHTTSIQIPNTSKSCHSNSYKIYCDRLQIECWYVKIYTTK